VQNFGTAIALPHAGTIRMSTVGLSFGSATSGTGFDVSTTVTQILAASGAVETRGRRN
jgi:hypothetical protein